MHHAQRIGAHVIAIAGDLRHDSKSPEDLPTVTAMAAAYPALTLLLYRYWLWLRVGLPESFGCKYGGRRLRDTRGIPSVFAVCSRAFV